MNKSKEAKFIEALTSVFKMFSSDKNVINDTLIKKMMSDTKCRELFVQAFTSKDFSPKGKNNDIYEKLGDKRWDSCMTLLFATQSTEVGGFGMISDAKNLALVTDKAKSNFYMDSYMEKFNLKPFVLKLDSSDEKVYADAFEALIGVLFINVMDLEGMGKADEAIYQFVKFIFTTIEIIKFDDLSSYMSDITLVKEWLDITGGSEKYTKSQEQTSHRGTLVTMGHTITAKAKSEKQVKNLVYQMAVKELKIDMSILKTRVAGRSKGIQSKELTMDGMDLGMAKFESVARIGTYKQENGEWKLNRSGITIYDITVTNEGKMWKPTNGLKNPMIHTLPIVDVPGLQTFARLSRLKKKI